MTSNSIDKMMFDKLSYRYKITGSLLIIQRINSEFPISDIIKWEEDKGVVYQLIKANTDSFKFIDHENKNIFLKMLLEEYKINVGITDVVIEIIKILANELSPLRLLDIDDLMDIMIKHMNKQGFEVVSHTITMEDLQNCIISLYQARINDSLEDICSMIERLLNQYNYKCFVSNIDVFVDRASDTVYEDILHISEFVIDTLKGLQIDTDEETISDDIANDEDESIDYLYNVYDEIPTNEDLSKYAIEYFPIELADLPREDTIAFMNAIYRVTIKGITSDTMMELIGRILGRFNNAVIKQYDMVCKTKDRAPLIVRNMIDIVDVEYRLPHLMYLVNGEFEIINPLVDCNFAIEYELCKKLIYIQQTYSNWYESKAMANEAVASSILNEVSIDMDNFRKLVILDEDM